MILFDLKCSKGHVFESWFKDGETFSMLAGAGQLACPHCQDTTIDKAPMAPRILKGGLSKISLTPEENPQPASEEVEEIQQEITFEEAWNAIRKLEAIRKEIEKRFDDVGEKFPEKARRMHYGEEETRNITGTATLEEVQELQEEGIDVIAVPGPAKKEH